MSIYIAMYEFRMLSRTAIALLCLAVPVVAQSSSVVLIDSRATQTGTKQQVQAAAKLYGLEVRTFAVADTVAPGPAIEAVRDPKDIAIVITADALQGIHGKDLLAAVEQNSATPLMIAGITERIAPEALKQWSHGAITGSQLWTGYRTAAYEVAPKDEVTRQLGGSKLPLSAKAIPVLTTGSDGASWLISASDGGPRHPVLVKVSSVKRVIFFSAAPQAEDSLIPDQFFQESTAFSLLAPDILFLHAAAGDRAWHSPGHYANLTIDDLWLREPYGFVNYRDLLQQMEQHNFHTTIAFIPWNYDRSQSDVVSLFREHPDRFSVCVHGNNHNHQEFGPLADHPLDRQIADIKQALARMAQFQKQTGISYDRVMVFPHKISPRETLAELKRYNFLSTVNGYNVPSDATAPADPGFALRPVTLAYANFPSVHRYSTELPLPEWELAMDSFLGNPILFYSHEAFFADGIGSFNRFADAVNRLQPDTRWTGLGDISEHLYLEKTRDDGSYDVMLFSPEIKLKNSHAKESVYFLNKDEDGAIPFQVLVDGKPQSYHLSNGQLRIRVSVAPGATVAVAIVYQNDLNVAQVDISKRNYYYAALRYLSDFRDDVVSRTAIGRWFSRSYVAYRTVWNSGGAITLLILAILFILRFRNRRLARHRAESI